MTRDPFKETFPRILLSSLNTIRGGAKCSFACGNTPLLLAMPGILLSFLPAWTQGVHIINSAQGQNTPLVSLNGTEETKHGL